MKNTYLLVLMTFGLLFSQCIHNTESDPQPNNSIDYDKESIKLMEELAPQLIGKWSFQQISINYQNHKILQNNVLGLSSDTVIFDLATLDIQYASKSRSTPPDARYPEFEGYISIGEKSYPVYFHLAASPERIVDNKGPHAFFLFEYNFPDGVRIPEKEETFLQDIGLINDNFSLQMLPRQRSMIWKGLNRGINRIMIKKL